MQNGIICKLIRCNSIVCMNYLSPFLYVSIVSISHFVCEDCFRISSWRFYSIICMSEFILRDSVCTDVHIALSA